MARVLALDVGDKRIGVALSDPNGVLASPLTILHRSDTESDIEAVRDIIASKGVMRVVVGMPLALDGGMGEQAEKVEGFVKLLRARLDIPLEVRDERLSTVTAQRLLREGGAKRGRRKGYDDAAAAAVILQGYLEECHEEEG